MLGLIDLARIIGPDTDGDYTVTLTDELHCRFAHVSTSGLGGTGALAGQGGPIADRRLLWDPSYEFPSEFVRVVVASSNSLPVGTRFQLVPGTLAAYRGPSGGVAFRSAYLVKAG